MKVKDVDDLDENWPTGGPCARANVCKHWLLQVKLFVRST